MKSRCGFVSNSSSSSFIVAFPCLAHTLPLRSLRELMFEGAESTSAFTDEVFSTEQIAETVLRDLNESQPKTREDILSELLSGWFDGQPEFRPFADKYPDREEMWTEYNKANLQWAEEFFVPFEKANPGHYYIVEYEDHGAYNATLEHGNIFRNLPHIRVNKH